MMTALMDGVLSRTDYLLFLALPLIAGFLADLAFGDPHFMPHPVRLIGKTIEKGEALMRRLFPATRGGERAGGTVLVLLVTALAFLVPLLILYVAALVHPVLAFVIEAVMCYQILAVKSLKTESMKVYDALEPLPASSAAAPGAPGGAMAGAAEEGRGEAKESSGEWGRNAGHNGTEPGTGEGRGTANGGQARCDLEKARYQVSMIVGRDTQCLTEEQVAKAAIETVAENTSDGTVAPMIFMAIGGAPLGFLYKAINTMDSMIGYKNDKYLYFGRTAAKLDDLANFIPARISGLLMILGSFILGMDARNAARIFRRDRFNHASPNSAQTEAVCAGALDIQLAGDAYYFGTLVPKQTIGDALRPVERKDIIRANRLLYATAWLSLILCLMGIGAFTWLS